MMRYEAARRHHHPQWYFLELNRIAIYARSHLAVSIMRIPASVSTLIAAALVLIGCTEQDFAYRTTAFGNDAATCNTPLRVSENAYVDGGYAETVSAANSPRIGCHISRYKVPRAKAWRDMAQGKPINANEADEYTLPFVEMPEKASGLLKPKQLSDLLVTLEKNREEGK